MKTGEYGIKELKTLLDGMSGMYDLVRVVDPAECRVLELGDDGGIRMEQSCYGIWNAAQKCANCQSAVALRTACHQEKCEYFRDHIYQIQSNPVKLRLPDGGRFDAVVEMVSVKSAPGGAAAARINDREAENTPDASARDRRMYDALTGMLKADLFYEHARAAMEADRDRAWKMIVGDIVDFRLFNVLFGAEKGNEVLLKIAELLEEAVGGAGGICSRLYRDRFAILLAAEAYSEKALAEISTRVNAAFSTGVYTIRIHFGVYDVTNTDIPVSVMCERATMALRKIDGSYRSSVAVFDDEIMQKSIGEQRIISGFAAAVEAGRIRMYLQPLFGDDGTPFGAEALARWIAPDGSVIPPAVFIKTLEDAGLIHRLDRYIWEQAVRTLALWKGTDKENFTISVNMSAKDFYNIDVYETLTGLTAKYGVENEKLRLEITESTLIENLDNITPAITKLQAAGFLVEIDDFGKGYSSLSLLKDISADILKIDMCFVQETGQKARSRIILQSVIEMAKQLGMRVITEGVETEPQLRALTAMGCDRFQGFYFSKPLPVEEFEARYARRA